MIYMTFSACCNRCNKKYIGGFDGYHFATSYEDKINLIESMIKDGWKVLIDNSVYCTDCIKKEK